MYQFLSLLFTFFFLTILNLSAQPEFTSIEVPAIGSTTDFKFVSETELSPGDAGNQTWDFSSYTFSATYKQTCYYASSTPGSSLYPSANLMIQNLATNYYSLTSSKRTLWGNYISAGSYNTYSDPAEELILPMSYNQTTTDSIKGTGTTSVGPNANKKYTIVGKSTTVYDGYGTIITNNGTYTNVIRIRNTLVSKQKLNAEETTVTYETYSWYQKGKIVFMLSIISTVSPGASSISKVAISYNISPATGLKDMIEPNDKLIVWPNPAGNRISLKLGDVNFENFISRYSIYNSNGEIVKEGQAEIPFTNILDFNISLLSAGHYILRLSDRVQNYCLKFVKE